MDRHVSAPQMSHQLPATRGDRAGQVLLRLHCVRRARVPRCCVSTALDTAVHSEEQSKSFDWLSLVTVKTLVAIFLDETRRVTLQLITAPLPIGQPHVFLNACLEPR